MTTREFFKAHGKEERYDEYLKECAEIAEDCEAEGYPSHGSNYELRVAQLEREEYSDLFGEEEE